MEENIVVQPEGDGQVSGTSQEETQSVIPGEAAAPSASAPSTQNDSASSAEAEEINPVPPEAPAPPPAPPAYSGSKKIIVVDDDANFREIFNAKFGAAGFEVKTAASGKALLELLAKGQFMPDLILMDINMPGETGTDLAFAIKQDPKTENLHVAFLTNQKEPWPAIAGNRDKVAKELGMEDFLEKGEDLDNLIQKVNDILVRISGQASA